MIEILQFVFSSFWTFAGTVVLIWVTGASFALLIAALRQEGKR